ncbi:MAG: ComF family protein [Victivallaceae bacterium]
MFSGWRKFIKSYISGMHCFYCGKLALIGDLCPECRGKLHYFKDAGRNLCPGCGGYNDGILEFCSRCLEVEMRPWRGAVALFSLDSFAEEFIYRMKGVDGIDLTYEFGRELALQVMANRWEVDVVVPIPLHWRRWWRRGFNQSEIIGEAVAGALDKPCSNYLRRKRMAAKQHFLGKKARWRNLANSFAPNWRGRRELNGMRILLVDDVLTTGATLHHAALALIDGGAAAVYIGVIGRR